MRRGRVIFYKAARGITRGHYEYSCLLATAIL
jgi:hypothetical protein